MTVFHEGDLYRYVDDSGKTFRILDSNDYITYTIDTDTTDSGVAEKVSTLLLNDQLDKGIIEPAEDKFQIIIEESSLSEKQKEKRDERYKVINTLWTNSREHRRFLERSSRPGLYRDIAKELNLSERAARTLVCKFLRGGMTRNSLLPGYKDRGGVGTERKSCGKDFPKGSGTSHGNVGKREREQFKEAYERKVLREGRKYTEAYEYLIEKYYSRTIKDSDGNNRTVYTDDIPNIRQFRYWVKKHRDRKKEVIARRGQKEFDNNYRVDMGSPREALTGPGSMVEIDAMHCNISVVSEFDRNLVIGRPLLYTAIDVWSGAVVGFYLGIENESWRTTALTLMNIIEDKVEFCRRYGIKIKPEDWPCHQLPAVVRADRGALNNPKVQEITAAYGTTFTYTPAYSPRYKPNIEHMHKYYQDYIESNLKKYGADQWNKGGRGAEDARERACLTIDELTKITIALTIKYNSSINQNYPLTPLMQAEGVVAAPAKLWKWGVSEGMATLKNVSDPEEFRLHLLERCKRKIRQDGIRLNTHPYVPGDIETARIFNNNPGSMSEVVYNPNDITEAYLLKDGQYHPLRMKDFTDSYRGMGVEEDRALRKQSSYLSRNYREREYLNQIDLDGYVKQVVDGKDGIVPKTKAKRKKRVKDINDNRKGYIRDVRLRENLSREADAVNTETDGIDFDGARSTNQDDGVNRRLSQFIKKRLQEIDEKTGRTDG